MSHVNCELIVAGDAKCNACKAYRSTLRALYSRYTKQKSKLGTSPTSHVNIRYLKTPERQKRFKNLKAKVKAASRKLANLESKIREDMAVNSIQLDEQLSLTSLRQVLKFNKFFDCMNVRCLDECILKCKPDVRPYNSTTDNRIKVLCTFRLVSSYNSFY